MDKFVIIKVCFVAVLVGKHCMVEAGTANESYEAESDVQCGANSPCLNQGKCSSSKTCICKCGFFGPLCEYSSVTRRSDYRNWCVTVNNTCHEGICLLDRNTCNIECICPAGYTGLYCNDTKPLTCGQWIGCAETRCDDDHKCVEDKCGNAHCEYAGTYNKSSVSKHYVVPVINVVIVTTMIVVMFICYKCKKRRKRLLASAEHGRESAPEENLRNASQNATLVSNPVYSISASTSPVSIDFPDPPVDYLPHSDLPTYEEACENPPSYIDIAKGYI